MLFTNLPRAFNNFEVIKIENMLYSALMKKLILLFIPILFNELFGINVKEINYSIDSESYPTTSDAIYIENDTIYCCSK